MKFELKQIIRGKNKGKYITNCECPLCKKPMLLKSLDLEKIDEKVNQMGPYLITNFSNSKSDIILFCKCRNLELSFTLTTKQKDKIIHLL